MRCKCHPQASRGWFPSAFQSICKLSTLMGRQSHPVVTKLRGGIVSFARNSSATLARSNVVSGWAAENKDHSALIAKQSRSNRLPMDRTTPSIITRFSSSSSFPSLSRIFCFPFTSFPPPPPPPLFVEGSKNVGAGRRSINGDKLGKLHRRATGRERAWSGRPAGGEDPLCE